MNGIIVVDKPGGWTSHDVVAKLRGLLGERRMGHSGTLDPMATGVLPVFAGRATRAVEFLEGADKEYVAALRFGLTTDTQDITGSELTHTGLRPGREETEAALAGFRGDIMQLPPMYSAVKIGGKKLYELARRGIEAERTPRPVTIRSLTIEGERDGDYIIRVVCSKGTYIRTLCADIGEALGCGAVMAALRRTRAGGFTLESAVTLERIASSDNRESLLLPTDSLFKSYPCVAVDAVQERKIRDGAAFAFEAEDGKYRVYGPDGAFLAFSEAKNGEIYTIKSFYEVQ